MQSSNSVCICHLRKMNNSHLLVMKNVTHQMLLFCVLKVRAVVHLMDTICLMMLSLFRLMPFTRFISASRIFSLSFSFFEFWLTRASIPPRHSSVAFNSSQTIIIKKLCLNIQTHNGMIYTRYLKKIFNCLQGAETRIKGKQQLW